MSARTKLPRFMNRKELDLASADFAASFARMEQDEDDRRTLRGKYAPTTWTCRMCHGGQVKPNIEFNYNGVLGGPPVQGHVAHWRCESCGLLYGAPPKDLA